MTIGNRGNPPGFLEYAKRRVLGKSALDVTTITPVPNTKRFSAYGALESGRGGFAAPPPEAAAGRPRWWTRRGGRVSGMATPALLRRSAEAPAGRGEGMAAAQPTFTSTTPKSTSVCGYRRQAVNRPIYKLLGAPRRASWPTPARSICLCRGFRPRRFEGQSGGHQGLQDPPRGGQSANAKPRASYVATWRRSGKSARLPATITAHVRPRPSYNVYSALKVGRLLEDQGYIAFEDPLPPRYRRPHRSGQGAGCALNIASSS